MDRVQDNSNGTKLLPLNLNNNSEQNQGQTVTHMRSNLRVIPARVLEIQSVMRGGIALVANTPIFAAYLTPHAQNFLLASHEWHEINPNDYSMESPVIVHCADNRAEFRLGKGRYGLDKEEFQKRYGQSFGDFITTYYPGAYYRPAQFYDLDATLLHSLGGYLPTADLYNLSVVDKHASHALSGRREKIENARLLASGKATLQATGMLAPHPYGAPITGPAQFNTALAYIKKILPEHQRKPLQALIQTASNLEQLREIFDHLESEKILPRILYPENFQQLPPEAQAAVRFFSWRLTGHLTGNPLAPSSPVQRMKLLQRYADLLLGIHNARNTFPFHLTGYTEDEDVRILLNVLDVPGRENMEVTAGRAWLGEANRRGDVYLTAEIFLSLPRLMQQRIVRQTFLPYDNHGKKSFEFASGERWLYPTT